MAQQAVLREHPDVRFRAAWVWIRMLKYDDEDAARRGASKVDRDPRIRQFWDPERRIGSAVATSLGGRPRRVAWDVYLVYDRGAVWRDGLPAPFDWAHQMTGTDWASMDHYFHGDNLGAALRAIMARLVE